MSALAALDHAAGPATPRPADGPTLDRIVAVAWARLGEHRSAACPLCGGAMAPVYGAHARPVGGRCCGCGTELS